MAKLKAQKRRRIRLRRLAVVVLAIVALLVTAVGVVTLRIRSILLSALRKQLPNCEVSIGRAVLNPLKRLSLYDVRIVDLSNPDARSTIEIEHLVAGYTFRAGLKLDIDVEVPASRVVLRNVIGDSPPFPDLFARKPERKPSRFRLRSARVRDCGIVVEGEGFRLSTTLQMDLTGAGRHAAGQPMDATIRLSNVALQAGAVATGDAEQDARSGQPAARTRATLRIGALEGALGYDGTRGGFLDCVLLRELRVRDAAIAIDDPNLEVSGLLELDLANETGSLTASPSRLSAVLSGFVFESTGFRTRELTNTLDLALYVRPADNAVQMQGGITIGPIAGTLRGVAGAAGLRLEGTFGHHKLEDLLGLWRRDGPYKIAFVHEFESTTGTVERLDLVSTYEPAPGPGFGLEGEIEATGLQGKSSSLALEVEDGALTMPFKLAALAPGKPIELSVGDPDRPLGTARLAAKQASWRTYAATDARGNLWMRDNHWWLDDLRGTLYEGRGWGTIHALPDTTLALELAFDDVNIEPLYATVDRENDQVTGHARGHMALTVGGGRLQSITAELRTKPPGGLIKIADVEKSFDAVPGGRQAIEALKKGRSSREYQHLLDKFKNLTYERIEINATTSGDSYIVILHVVERKDKDPLDIEFKFDYQVERIRHVVPPKPQETIQ